MSCSPARLAANRRNAQLSTGPRTAEGKARSRSNAVRHGLTGAGVALPVEDAAAVEEQFRGVAAELAPRTLVGEFLAEQMALAMVRCRRAARQEAVALASRVRRAPAAFDEARLAAADALFAALAADPAAARRRLLATPEGVDRLADAFESLRADLAGPLIAWDNHRHRRLGMLCGASERDFAGTHLANLSRAILGLFVDFDPGDLGPDAAPRSIPDWACDRVIEALDAELAALVHSRAAAADEALALDRAEAAARATFDPGREATLARKYEAAARRDFSRALREFAEAEALALDLAAPDDAAPDPAVAPEPEPPRDDVEPAVERADEVRPAPAPESEPAPEPAPPAPPAADRAAAVGSFGENPRDLGAALAWAARPDPIPAARPAPDRPIDAPDASRMSNSPQIEDCKLQMN